MNGRLASGTTGFGTLVVSGRKPRAFAPGKDQRLHGWSESRWPTG